MHAIDSPQHAEQHASVRLDTLPSDLLLFIANGTDAKGHPILDPRCRFQLAQVSHKLRAYVSCPLRSDAARLARHPGATEAWVKGRAASIALVVSQCQSRGVTPEEAARDFVVPSDPHRGEIAALLATAPTCLIVREFVSMVERLIPTTTTEWFPHPHNTSCIGGRRETGDTVRDDTPLGRRSRACRNVVALVCLLGRSDAALDIFSWYNIMCLRTMGACLRAAIARDDGPLVSALLCCVASRPQQFCNDRPSWDLFKHALFVAGAAGKINALRHLVVKGMGQKAPGSLADYPSLAAVHTCYCQDRRKCAFEENNGVIVTHRYWVQTAAAHDQVDVFTCADAEGWDYEERQAIKYAVASGSINVANHMARRFNPTTHSAARWAKKLFTAIAVMCVTTDAESLARGMAWLVSRGVVFALPDTIDLACRLWSRPDLMPCALAVATPSPDPTVPFPFGPHTLHYILSEGEWTMLSRIIVAYGRASDEARVAGQQTHDPTWWTHITRNLQIARSEGAPSSLIMQSKGTPRALFAAYRIARLCQRIPPTPTASKVDDSLVPFLGDIGDDNARIDPVCWARWCNPAPIYARPDADALDPNAYNPWKCDEKVWHCIVSVLAVLDEAGLVTRTLASTPGH
ncbi:hypothetical protein pclt_cds_728 [Pandoravirus celtis]|uniref:Uncharacterized protein n=1 Tax=Pandoravirus celtis TaxID=2568002 RepID=A0A4D6EHY4_9VIRU|nr:hypothetical protein pclt_cds_728 [Pandoravirus celtis]